MQLDQVPKRVVSPLAELLAHTRQVTRRQIAKRLADHCAFLEGEQSAATQSEDARPTYILRCVRERCHKQKMTCMYFLRGDDGNGIISCPDCLHYFDSIAKNAGLSTDHWHKLLQSDYAKVHQKNWRKSFEQTLMLLQINEEWKTQTTPQRKRKSPPPVHTPTRTPTRKRQRQRQRKNSVSVPPQLVKRLGDLVKTVKVLSTHVSHIHKWASNQQQLQYASSSDDQDDSDGNIIVVEDTDDPTEHSSDVGDDYDLI